MSRPMLFVLLLAAGAVLAGDRLAARQAAGAQPQTGVAGTPAQEAPGPTEETQGATKEAQEPAEGDGKLIAVPGGTSLGMSILGNKEAPTSLVIVPWKSSELGDSAGISTMLDDSKRPVDKDVFMRALRYYEIRSETGKGPRP